MKRPFDLVCSSIGLLIFSPLLLAIAVWVKLDSRGPVFYLRKLARRAWEQVVRHLQVPLDGHQRRSLGGASTSAQDKRITASGRFIRRYKLDELAQLINVFLGDMSVVGPRPEVLSYTSTYTGELLEIFTVRPGDHRLGVNLEFR